MAKGEFGPLGAVVRYPDREVQRGDDRLKARRRGQRLRDAGRVVVGGLEKIGARRQPAEERDAGG